MEKNQILTLDIGASKIRVQTVDTEGNAGTEYLVNLTGLSLDNEKLIQIVVENIRSAIKDKDSILAIGICVPGPVDPRTGRVEKMPNIRNVFDLDLRERIKNVFNLDVFVINDADAGALGELWLGQGKDHRNLIYLTFGSGVGSGMITDGTLQPRSELGHTVLTAGPEERTCSCWKINCAESFLGTKGLAQIYDDVFGTKSDEKGIGSVSFNMRKGIKSGDKRWLTVLDEYAGYLSVFLKNITAVYWPEVIILGGGIAFGNEALLNAVDKELGGDIQIVLAKFENAPNLGAAKYAMMNIK